ncbi:MAG: PKD domain-containing protein, partial [Candidatus Delongbacteria bacterium]|nr:PKD domain-containing protein [Candidatus Delongbacteria bacterium]
HFDLYKPSGYNINTSPILWYVHGSGGSGAEGISVLHETADRRDALIVSPTMQNGVGGWAYVTNSYKDTISNCDYLIYTTEIFKQIYRHVLERETRDSIPIFLTGFSQGGQFVSRYMLIRQFNHDYIPIRMAVSVSAANYTLCNDTFNGTEMIWSTYRCGLAWKEGIIYCPDSVPAWTYIPVDKLICNSHVKQYYNENYAVLIGTNDTADFPGFCPDQPGNDRYERAIAFYNFSDTNAINRGTTLKWQYAEIPDVVHWGTALYNTPAEGDSIPIAERILFETPYHPVPDFSPHVAFIYEDSALSVHFTDISQYVDSYWHWDFGDGDSSLVTNPIHTYPQAGFYTVCLTAGDSCSTDTWCKEIAVTSSDIENIETDAARFSVHPNPANDKAVVEFMLPQDADVSLKLYNTMGECIKLVYRGNCVSGQKNTYAINTSDLKQGVYFVSLQTDKHSLVRKLMLIK